MNLHRQAQTLGLTAMLALSVIAMPVVHVHAQDNGASDGIEMDCLNKSTGEWTLSGQVDYVKTSSGTTYVVGCDNGKWVNLGPVGGREITPAPARPVLPPSLAAPLG